MKGKTFRQKVRDRVLSALGGLLVLLCSLSILGVVLWLLIENLPSSGEPCRTLLFFGCFGIIPFGTVAVFAIRDIRNSWRDLDRMEAYMSSLSEEERRELQDAMAHAEDVSVEIDAEGRRHFVPTGFKWQSSSPILFAPLHCEVADGAPRTWSDRLNDWLGLGDVRRRKERAQGLRDQLRDRGCTWGIGLWPDAATESVARRCAAIIAEQFGMPSADFVPDDTMGAIHDLDWYGDLDDVEAIRGIESEFRVSVHRGLLAPEVTFAEFVGWIVEHAQTAKGCAKAPTPSNSQSTSVTT